MKDAKDKYIGCENEKTECRCESEIFRIGDKCDIIHTKDGKGFLDFPIKGTLIDIELTPISEYFSEQTAIIKCDSDGGIIKMNPKYLQKPMEQISCKICKKILSYTKELFWSDNSWNYEYHIAVKDETIEVFGRRIIEPICTECWKKLMFKVVSSGRSSLELTQEEYKEVIGKGHK